VTATLTREQALARAANLPTEAKARLRWNLQRRPTQTPPDGDWLVWLILAGRGFGKTRTGAEWIAEQAWRHPGTRWAIVAPTFGDARDTCVEGDSGLLHALGGEVRTWNRSLGELELVGGSKVKLFSADEPERLRGPQHHGAWCDELAAWRYPEAWDQLQFGLRLVAPGLDPRTVVTTTPKPTALVRQLVDRATTHVTTGGRRSRTPPTWRRPPSTSSATCTRAPASAARSSTPSCSSTPPAPCGPSPSSTPPGSGPPATRCPTSSGS
jgi:phage terminase large subunit-like protein